MSSLALFFRVEPTFKLKHPIKVGFFVVGFLHVKPNKTLLF